MLRPLALKSLVGCAALAALSGAHPSPPPQIDTDPVFKTLPPPKPGEPAQTFHFKEGATAPPRPGERALPFPPSSEQAKPAAPTIEPGPLAVTRHQPDGAQEIVGAVSATFNQPMVPLASITDLRAHPVPLQIEPLPKGRFRWLGTQTVELEPEGRMPYATAYTARIPAGTRSALGQTLAREVTWHFETPRPKLEQVQPPSGFSEATPDQLLQLSFNQAVSPAQVRDALRCHAGARRVAWTLSRPAQDPFEDDRGVDVAMRKKLFEERNVFLRPAQPLARDTLVECALPPGFRGAEGPLPSLDDPFFFFRTYAPLRLMGVRCGWEPRCPTASGIAVEFNNALDEDQRLIDLLRVSPQVNDLTIVPSGRALMLEGSFQPSTTYHVAIRGEIRDVHGQTLGREANGKVTFDEDEPSLALVGAPWAVLESHGPRLIPVEATNLSSARLRYVKLDFKHVREAMERVASWTENDPLRGFSAAVDRTVRLAPRDNPPRELGLGVDEVLGKGPGLLAVDLQAALPGWRGPVHRSAVIEVTDLGVTAHLTDEQAVVLVTSLEAGRPIAGARVSLRDADDHALDTGVTDARGTAALSGPGRHPGKPPLLIAVQKDDDRAFLLLNRSETGEMVSSYTYGAANPHQPTAVASLFTDKSPYKPGEKVHLAGVVRVATHGPRGAVRPVPAGARIDYELTDSRGQKAAQGAVDVGPLGVFSVDIDLAADASLGRYGFRGTLRDAGSVSGQTMGTGFEVAAYRTPEHKVSIDTGGATHFTRDALEAKVRGEYYFGGAMAGAPASWTLTRSPGSFAPPHLPGFSFGENEVAPYWEWGGHGRRTDVVARGSGALDATGQLAIAAALDPGEIKGPVTFKLEASVTDANRQVIAANATVLAHAGAIYPGLKLDRNVVKAGETVRVTAIAEGIDGKRQVAPMAAELIARSWERVKAKAGGWRYEMKEEPVGGCDLKPSQGGDKEATCRIEVARAGQFAVRVTARDDRGRSNRSAQSVWAYGKGFSPWLRPDQSLSVDLVADENEYVPGQTAWVLVRSPFPHSVGLLAIDREGLVEWRALDFEGATTRVEIPLTEAEAPNVTLTVGLVRGRISPEEAGAAPGDPDDAGRPMYAGGAAQLKISLASHSLKVSVAPEHEAIAPGSKMKLRVRTADDRGAPLASRLIVAVVDEGVLALLGYHLPDPLRAIFEERRAEGGTTASLPRVLPRHAQEKRGAVGRPMPAEPKAAAPPHAPQKRGVIDFENDVVEGELTKPDGSYVVNKAPRLAARTFFASTAYFDAGLHTDARGELTLEVPMPDNLTRYRIMAVAVAGGDRFGEGDGTVQVQRPIMIRPSLPRFLNLGDRFLASAVIHNQTDRDLWIDAQARAANGAVSEKRQRVFVPAGQAREVAFEAHAGLPGPSRWQLAAVALDAARSNDAAEIEIPVELPATAEAFATYGSTERSVLQPIQLPADALPGFGGLEVSLSSTALTSLADAVAYLRDYPYECVEQTTSRIVPFIALRQAIRDFHVKGIESEPDVEKAVDDGVARIFAKQRGDGGFGYWADSRESHLFVSSWAGYVLARARTAGYAIDARKLAALLGFLRARLAQPRRDLGEDEDDNSQSLAALVLGMLGSPDAVQVRRLYDHRDRLAIFGKAWLLEAARDALGARSQEVAELDREIQSAAVEKPSSAHFAESKGESLRLLMHSNERTDAIVLAALIHARPDDPLIPKIVHGLNESQRHGRWGTTQSNAWATVALGDYYRAFEKVAPDFAASVFVGGGFVGQVRFAGRQTDVLNERIPFSAMTTNAPDLILDHQGQGRLYYRLGLRYAPKSLKLGPAEQGFAVSRSYEAMPDAPGTVITSADGSVRIRAGAEVRVTLRVAVSDRAELVAIDDPLPAGLEAVNTHLLTNQSERIGAQESTVRARAGGWGFWSWNPFDHTELRDERVLLFADQLPAGVYTHTYVARATTRGTFQVPPARALEMYEPENFGRTASAVVTVE